MKYIKNIPSKNFEEALCLVPAQVEKIDNAIAAAYVLGDDTQMYTIDNIVSRVAPQIETPEEAFYAASMIHMDMFKAMLKAGVANELIKE